MQATLTQTKVPHVAASQMHVVFASSKSLYKGFCVLQQYVLQVVYDRKTWNVDGEQGR
jgi:hypothetical protein